MPGLEENSTDATLYCGKSKKIYPNTVGCMGQVVLLEHSNSLQNYQLSVRCVRRLVLLTHIGEKPESRGIYEEEAR